MLYHHTKSDSFISIVFNKPNKYFNFTTQKYR